MRPRHDDCSTCCGRLQMDKRLAQLRTRQDVLLPVLPAQEILPCQFALSESRSTLKKGYIYTGDLVLCRLLGDFFNDHLAHEGNRDASDAVHDFIGAWNHGPGEIRAIAGLGLRRMFARLRDELLEAHRHVVGDPLVDVLCSPGGIGALVLELLRQPDEQRLQTRQALLQGI